MLFDAFGEARVHRAFLLYPSSRTAQQERLLSLRAATDLHFDILADVTPAGSLGDLLGETP